MPVKSPVPVAVDEATIAALREKLPELPDARQARFTSDYGLGAYDASQLAGDKALADYFEATVAACGDAKLSANWIIGDIAAALNSTYEAELLKLPEPAQASESPSLGPREPPCG